MKSSTVLLIICFLAMSVLSGCTVSKWEQVLAGEGGRASDPQEAGANDAETMDWPSLEPAQYRLKAPNTGGFFLVWVPVDYDPNYSWPVIFCYHGAGGSATTRMFYEITDGRGFIVVAMNYADPVSGHGESEWLEREKAFFSEALSIVSDRLNVDTARIFMAGTSRGGYHASLLGEQLLDDLAGLVILAAGRHPLNPYLPTAMRKSGIVNMTRNVEAVRVSEGMGVIKGKPIYIGVGEKDSVHNWRAKEAARVYKLWGADVTFQEWPGFGHNVNSVQLKEKLSIWLKDVCAQTEGDQNWDTREAATYTHEESPVGEQLPLTPEPLLKPGQYVLNAPEAKNSFILWVPWDYDPEYSWPVIFRYPGFGGSAVLQPFDSVTNGRGFIIVGMNYIARGYNRYSPQLLDKTEAFFFEALNMVSARLNVDPEMIFMGGFSQGGYHTTFLGEQVLDNLAGLIVMGAGRYAVDQKPPPMDKIRDKPIFIGIGEDDSVHNPRARNAARIYEDWGANVTFEEWPGVGHTFGNSKLLLKWLEDIFSGSEVH